RVRTLLEFEEPDSDIYAISKLPKRLVWTTVMGPNGKSPQLCAPTSTRPVLVWNVGHITKLWLFDFGGKAHTNAAVTVL
ncbi:hypothetical protein BV25DRAFT_1772625, partial [Artomyces pyxidatus]